MPYRQIRGRKPFERASKISHSQIVSSPIVQHFLSGCTLPEPPPQNILQSLIVPIPEGTGKVSTVVAIDGGMTETSVREEYPSATIAFMSFGPLLLRLSDLDTLEGLAFIGPDDMARLRNIERYNLVLPTRSIRAAGANSFSEGVRRAIYEFLSAGNGHLGDALAWLLFRAWRQPSDREPWRIPRCPKAGCTATKIEFLPGKPLVRSCPTCGEPVYLSDALRLYERVDDEHGAAGILSYLLTALEQLVLTHLLKAIVEMKPQLLEEILFIKDGPLAFFGTTAPLSAPMRDLMGELRHDGRSLIHLAGVEKSGPFVEHAAQIEKLLDPNSCLFLGNEYIYRYIVPGDSSTKVFGANTYYGAKTIVRGDGEDTYVVSIPTRIYARDGGLEDLYNAGEIFRVLRQLRCSMYDNALVPVVLANQLVSLADVPSSEILKRFAKGAISTLS